MLARSIFTLAAAAAVVTATPVRRDANLAKGENDFSCRSTTHPNPVIALHGLFANANLDLNFLEDWLRPKGFCTFSLTYGTYPLVPLGGLKSINESSFQIADFIKEVLDKTGAEKVDIVGHSEGGLQSLYVPKFRHIASRVDRIIAIAPPTHGTTVGGITSLADALKIRPQVDELLETAGCGACEDVLVGSDAIKKLNDGPIAQPGNKLTIIISRHDNVVTPSETAAVVQEPGVNNIFVQDYCPKDPVGHISLAIDKNVWNLVLNSLEDKVGRKFPCTVAPPIRRDEYAEVAI